MILALLAAGLLPSSTAAQPPEDVSGVDQYVEIIPAGDGGESRSKPRTPAPLMPSISKRIEETAETDAQILEEIATSPDLGAPQTKSKAKIRGTAASSVSPDVSLNSALSSAVDPKSGSTTGDRTLSTLLAALALITAACLTVVLWRFRRGRHVDS